MVRREEGGVVFGGIVVFEGNKTPSHNGNTSNVATSNMVQH